MFLFKASCYLNELKTRSPDMAQACEASLKDTSTDLDFIRVNSHVIPVLMRRFHEAKLNSDAQVISWGIGKSKREYLYVDDVGAASIHVMNLNKEIYDGSTQPMLIHINVGTGLDCTIKELVQTVAKVVGFKDEIKFNATKPDGAPKKLLNIDRLKR